MQIVPYILPNFINNQFIYIYKYETNENICVYYFFIIKKNVYLGTKKCIDVFITPFLYINVR